MTIRWQQTNAENTQHFSPISCPLDFFTVLCLVGVERKAEQIFLQRGQKMSQPGMEMDRGQTLKHLECLE